MAMGEVVPEVDDPEVVKSEWLGRLDALVGDVKTWAEASGWKTRRISKTITERRLGTYKAPVLLLEKNAVEVVLNPVARHMPGAAGAIDLYLAPAYDDIASLYFEDDHWVIHYASPTNPIETEPLAYSEQTIRMILDGMATHA